MKNIILTIFLIMGIFSVQASEEISNKDLSKIVNGLLCSDNPQEMSEMVVYPFNGNSGKDDFINKIKRAQKEDGPYKFGKSCNGFVWSVSQSGGVYQALSSDLKVIVDFTVNEGKITGIKGRRTNPLIK